RLLRREGDAEEFLELFGIGDTSGHTQRLAAATDSEAPRGPRRGRMRRSGRVVQRVTPVRWSALARRGRPVARRPRPAGGGRTPVDSRGVPAGRRRTDARRAVPGRARRAPRGPGSSDGPEAGSLHDVPSLRPGAARCAEGAVRAVLAGAGGEPLVEDLPGGGGEQVADPL